MMRGLPAISVLAIAVGATGAAMRAQQTAGGTAAAPAQPTGPSPSAFRLTQQDFDLAVNISRAIASGDQAQVKKIFADNHLSIPQFEHAVTAICDLSAEQRFANARPAAKSSKTEVRAMTISNLPDARSRLAARISQEFGGRGRNYQDARTLVKRQSSAADEVCNLQTPRTGTAR